MTTSAVTRGARFSALSFRRRGVAMIVWPIGVLLMHFTLSQASGQILNIALIANIVVYALLLPGLVGMKKSTAILALFAVAVTLAVGLADSDLEVDEFIKSALQFGNLTLMLAMTMSIGLPRPDDMNRGARLLIALAGLHALLLVAQFVAMNVLHSNALMNPFGPFSRLGPLGEPYVPFYYEIVLRPNGFFSEPSVAAWFSGFAFATALAMSLVFGGYIRAAALIGAGALFTGSLSGVLNVSVIVLCFAWLRVTRLSMRDVVVAFGLIALLVMAVLWYIQSSYFTARVGEVGQQGSSMYVRISSPLMLLSDSLASHPLGHALGSEKYILSKSYAVVNEATATEPGKIHNGFLLVVFFYGWLGLAVVLAALVYLVRLLMLRRPSSLILVSLYLAIVQSGGLWSPSYVLIIGLGILLMRYLDASARAKLVGAQWQRDIGAIHKQRLAGR